VDEAQWLACPDPQSLLGSLHTRVPNVRQLVLFACACCRRVWHLALSRRSLEAVDTVERYWDRLPGGERLPAARKAASAAYRAAPKGRPDGHRFARAAYLVTRAGDGMTMSRMTQAARLCAEAAVHAGNDLGTWARERAVQADLLRDLFNPFLPAPTVEAARQAAKDSTVARMVAAIHEAGDFASVPVLADALEEAGCEDRGLLDHCRGGPHVRGCWAVDLLQGRSA
jgi:hypothetical protein